MAEKGKKVVRETAVILGMGTIVPGKDGPKIISSYPGLSPDLANDPYFTEFARAAMPFIVPGHTQDHELAVKTGYRMKETGNKLFHEGKYELAAANYRYSMQLFNYVVKTYPYVATEVLLLNSNLSVSHYKLKEYCRALEYANICIELDHHFIKGYFRRAEASHALAEEEKASGGQDVVSLYYDALRDYCKCYKKMTAEKERSNRLKQFVEALLIALELSATKFLPDFHETDQDKICGQIIILLVSNYSTDKVEKGLNFLFFPNPSIEKSGLAIRYKCDVSALSVTSVYSKRVLTEPILNILVHCNLLVRPTDLAQMVPEMRPRKDFSLFERLIEICESKSKDEKCEFSEVLDKALIAKNNPFAVYLLTVKEVIPTIASSGLAFAILASKPAAIYKRISCLATPSVRADFAAKAVIANNIVYFEVALSSGILDSSQVDLSALVGASLMNKERRYLTTFLTTGASPDGVAGSPAPLTAVFRGNSLTRETQVHVVIVLIEAGASIKHLSSAFPDPMSPLHVATKLVLETGIMKVLELVCDKFEFPSNGRIVDKHNRTPLHLVMLSEPSLQSIQILEYLVAFNIDKAIKDDQGKRAEDYALVNQDKRRKLLVSVDSSSSKGKSARREMLRESEVDDFEDEEDLETWKKWESKFERMPKLMRMAFAKKGGPYGCDMNLFPPTTTFEEALAIARTQKEAGNVLFGEKKYSEALSTYGKCHMKFDWICANYPRKIPKIKDDIKVLSCNMALGYHRSGVPEASVECCNDAIDIDPEYFKAYYRRAEAYKYIAQHRTHPNKQNYNFDCFCNAVKDYARAYTYSVSPSDINKRSEWYFECLIIAIDVGHTETLPTIHECDKPLLLTKVIEHLTKHDTSYYTKELEIYLNFILLKNSRLPNAGLAHSYPCSCASVSVTSLLPNVQSELLKALLSRGCIVLSDDIVESVRCLKKSQLPIMKQLLDSFVKDLDKDDVSLTAICNEIMTTKKLHFISLLVKAGAKPNPESILEYADFSKLDSVLTKYVAAACSPASRTKLFCCILQTGTTKEAVEVTLNSGPLLIEDIDLSVIITSTLLVHHTEILSDLLKVTPQSSLPLPSSSQALIILFSSKFPSPLQQTQLAESLIKFGADINLLSHAYSEPLGPLHIATKLALETGHAELIPVVCSKFVFDGQAKLIDKNTQTPLHYVLRAKHNDRTVKICEYLCDYPIDPYIKDRWGKTAQDYGRTKGDKRLQYLEKAALLTGHRVHTTSTFTISSSTSNDNETTTATSLAPTTTTATTPLSSSSTQEQKGAGKKKKKKSKGGSKVSPSSTQDDNDTCSIESSTRTNAGTTACTSSNAVTFTSAGSAGTSKVKHKEIVEVTNTTNNKPVITSGKKSKSIIKKTSSLPPPPPPQIPNLVTLLDFLNQRESKYFELTFANTNTLLMSLSSTNTNVETSLIAANAHHSPAIIIDIPLKNVTTKSINFDHLLWEIECTDKFILFLKDPNYKEQIKRHVLSKLESIASGTWTKGDSLSRSIIKGGKTAPVLYEAIINENVSIVWEIAVQFSPKCSSKVQRAITNEFSSSNFVFSEVVRIWDIVSGREHKLSCIQDIQASHERGLTESNINYQLLLNIDRKQYDTSGSLLPRHYALLQSCDPSQANNIIKYIPSINRLNNVNLFYSLSSLLVESSILKTRSSRRDFPFKEWPNHYDIIHAPFNEQTILLVGHSGTGKTTCCLYRLWNEFNEYWKRVSVSSYPRKPLPLIKMTSIELKDLLIADEPTTWPTTSPDASLNNSLTQFDDLHQVFLTNDSTVCSQVKKQFYNLAASHDSFTDHMTHENDPPPLSLTSIDTKAFPLFQTLSSFLILLDGSLEGETFFPCNQNGSLAIEIIDYNHTGRLDFDITDEFLDESDHHAKQPIWHEVTSCYFVSEIWPKICHHCSDKNIDPLLVWNEIKYFIKGSLLAVGKTTGELSPWEYEAIGRKTITSFNGHRTEIYTLYEHYKNHVQQEKRFKLFDQNDLVSNIHQRLTSCHGNSELSWSIHRFFIDGVQNFTQAELVLLLRVCREPNSLFLTGDTSEGIINGNSFHFRDLCSLFHLINTQSTKSLFQLTAPRLYELDVNFQTHSGIVNLASSIIELLCEYYPSLYNNLPKDQGVYCGPLPVFLHSCQVSDLALWLQGCDNKMDSSFLLGPNQVVIVRNEESKKSLPEFLIEKIVLTVDEAKGLEFNDVLLYNFFADSQINKEWRVVTTYADKTTPPSGEKPKPRPLNFNERFYKSLHSEFKNLYLAITRAKHNILIFDSNETCRLPVLDYWSRRALIRVVRAGDDDGNMFMNNDWTLEEWSQQGDCYFRKELWELAMKCYRKSGNYSYEKEAESYFYINKAKTCQNQGEMRELFEKAALSFLSCDYISHNVKHIDNAAKCLRSANKYHEAGKLYESLGQIETAKKCYIKAKDHTSLSRLSETEGHYSEAIRVLVKANERIKALETAERYETSGFHIEPDVCSLQLANTFAKYYISRHEESQLMKVLSYIPNLVQRVSHLKKGKLYKLAVEEYIKADQYKDAERLMLAQEMFDKGIEFAKEVNIRGMESRFVLYKVVACIYHNRMIDDNLNESLLALTKSTLTPVAQAKALLLSGMVHSKPSLCKDAVKMFTETCINHIGALEAFNQCIILKKKEVPYSQVVEKCFEAQEHAKVFRSSGNTPTRSKTIQQTIEFYKISKFENIYLLAASQDIWIKSLQTAILDTDENGMLVLEPSKVHFLLVDRFTDFSNRWFTEAKVEKQIISCLSSFSFHHDVSESGYLTSHLTNIPPNLIKDYIQLIDTAIKTSQLFPNKLFRGYHIESLPLKLFSFTISLCLPLTKMNCFQFRRSETVRPVLMKTMDSLLHSRCLRQPHVDDLFKAWFCQALIDSDKPNYVEETIEAFAEKEGFPVGHTTSWLVMDKHSKDSVVYHHFFAFWLKACRLIREGSQIIVATKLVYNCFFCVIARRPTLRKTVSIMNYVFPLSIFAIELLGILSVGRANLGICVPIFYRYQCQLFDILNIKGTKQFWMLSACVQFADEKQNDKQMFEDAKDLLHQMLELLLGVYQPQFNPLKISLNSETKYTEDGSLLHCLVTVLVLLGNIMIMRPNKHEQHYHLLLKVIQLVKEFCDRSPDDKIPSYLKTVLGMLQSANTVADIFVAVQCIYKSANYPSYLGKFYAAKSGNMDFREFSSPPQYLSNIIFVKSKLSTSQPLPSQPPPSTVVVKEEKPQSEKEQLTILEEKEDPSPLIHVDELEATNVELTSSSSSTSSLTGGEATSTSINSTTVSISTNNANINNTTTNTTTNTTINTTINPSTVNPSTTTTNVDLPRLQQQWIYNTQRLEELRQYHNIVEQQLIQLRQVPSHLITQAHEQQQRLLTQQYYQILQAHRQYQLQQEAIQRQYQLLVLNGGQGKMGQAATVLPNTTMPSVSSSTNVLNTAIPVANSGLPVANSGLPVANVPNSNLPIGSMSRNAISNSILATPSGVSHSALPAVTNNSFPIRPTIPVMVNNTVPLPTTTNSRGFPIVPDNVMPTNVLPIGPTSNSIYGGGASALTQQTKDEVDVLFDEEEIEKILGSFMSDQPIEKPPPAIRDEMTLMSDDDHLVDKQNCQVCGLTFEQRNTILEELEEEEKKEGLGFSSFMPEYKKHIETQSHLENLLAYKKFNSVKSGPFAVLRGKLNEVLRKGQELSTVAEVEALLLQVNSELREMDEQLEEFVNSYNWKEAHSRTLVSLDVLQAHTSRLMRTCEAAANAPSRYSLMSPVDEDDIEVAAKEFRRSQNNKKRQKKK